MSLIFRFLLKLRMSIADVSGGTLAYHVYQLHGAVTAVVVLSVWVVVWSGIAASSLGKGGAHDD